MVLKSTGSGCAALVNEVNRANANRENKGTRFFIKYSLSLLNAIIVPKFKLHAHVVR